MKTKHTKGEWIACHWVKSVGQGDCYTEIRASGSPYGRLIAELNFDTSDDELSAYKCKANAKLIAAAPDLLKSLIRCVERLEENDLGKLHAVKIAKEVIQKATN